PTDYLSPMIYPSHYTNPELVYNPGKLVEMSMRAGMERVKGEFRPFIQGFDRAMPPGINLIDYMKEELKALERVGVEGYLVWNPKSNYESLWKTLETID
ncbi:MAG: putative glycoside hydrolase, partial [Candidatus Bipolaricaulota bacterium]